MFLCYVFKGRHPVALFTTEIQLKSVQTQHFIYYEQLHVSTYFRSDEPKDDTK